ncbi:hypothetical protein WJX81_006152 [Elliptochloris bilobata]|uniref:Sucrose phosphatase-like domain-containing protein n=1 Tax=Elliptochloris bilobata TaxID=381761 RepID=A0AAW1RXI4_9CHLO
MAVTEPDSASKIIPDDDKNATSLKRICFSDIDGTLVHYRESQDQYGELTTPSVLANCMIWVEKESGRRHKLLMLPPSATNAQGMISIKTLTDLSRMRSAGTMLVLVTGARTATLLQRLPFLPAADAYVCENGGRIFYPDATLPTACQLAEDARWRARHTPTVGATSHDSLPAAERKGLLWDTMRALMAQGWEPDTFSYSTAFRLRLQEGKTEEDLTEALASLPAGLAHSRNLHAADVYPETSGKDNAARHLMQRFDAAPHGCFLLCDDDNDLRLAALVGKAFVVGATAPSVAAAARADPERFVLAQRGGTLGIEELMEKVEDFVGSFILG